MTSKKKFTRQSLLIALVVVAALLLGALILYLEPAGAAKDAHGHGSHGTADAVHAHADGKAQHTGEKPAAAGAAEDHEHALEQGSKDAHGHAHDAHDEQVALSDQQLQQSGVQLRTAGPAPIAQTLQLLGEVRLNQDRTVKIVPRLAGVVEAAPVSAGERVRKGQVLAVLSSQALAEHRSALLTAQQRLSLARSTYDREKALWQDRITAEQDYLQARTALEEARIAVNTAQHQLAVLGAPMGNARGTAALARYEIRAPIAGVVIDKQLTVGQALQADTPVLTVADLSSVWVEVTLRLQDLGGVQVGQSAAVQASGFDATGQGRIAYISALVGEQTRTASARLLLPNPEGQWRPGLPVQVVLTTATAEVPVAVASTALQTVEERPVVFVRQGQAFAPRPVEAGRSDGTLTEIRQGLEAGEVYAAGNSFLLKAELGKASASHDH